MTILGLVLAAALTAPLTDPGRADLAHPVKGYTYFHRAGASLADEEKALLRCGVDGIRLYQPSADTMWTGKPVRSGHVLPALIDMLADKNFRAANLENCMVAHRWQVMRLPDAVGSQWQALDPLALRNKLAEQVAAEAPLGEVARTWANDAANPQTAIYGSNPISVRVSLSVRALPRPTAEATDPPALNLGEVVEAAPVSALTNIPKGKAVIIVRHLGRAGGGVWIIVPDARPNNINVPYIETRSTFSALSIRPKDHGEAFAYVVDPGRWILTGYGGLVGSGGPRMIDGVTFCHGAPAFDVAAGEVIFAGTYWYKGPQVLPDLDPAPVRDNPTTPEAVKARLKPATLMNGATFPCDAMGYGYALEVPGAPYLPDAER